MASANRDRIDSYSTCTVGNQAELAAHGAQPRMLAQSLKHAFKTRRTPVPPLWLERSYPTCTVSKQKSDRTADGAQCWRNH